MARQPLRSTVTRREGSSPALPIILAVLLAIGVGGYFWYANEDRPADPAQPAIVATETTRVDVPPPPPAPLPVTEPAPTPPTPKAELVTPVPEAIPPTRPAEPKAPPPEPAPPAATVTAPPPAPVASVPTPADPSRDFGALGKAAAQGDADSQFYLAQAYRDGVGTKSDPVRALAWFMQAAARGQAEAAGERDRALASLGDTAKVQAESLSRSLPVPMPAGWLSDPVSGVRVWSPSWHRNGTFKVRIEGAAVDGLVDGPAKVTLTATLYGSTDRSYEGVFSRGLLLDERLRAAPQSFELLETDEMRMPLAAPADAPAIQRLWRQTRLASMLVEACPSVVPHLFAEMAPDFTGIDDVPVKAAGVAAVQALNAVCPLDGNTQAQVTLLPPGHAPVYGRRETNYAPRLADVQLYGFNQPATNWSISVNNLAREAHAKREAEAEQQRKRSEREQKEARDVAAAMARPMPDVRGFKLGLSFEQFKAAIGADAATWMPKLKDDHKMPDFASFEQKVVLNDGASFTAVFASAQNGSRLMALSYEQHLRDGPEPETLRQQLYGKYGKADEELGQGSTLTWWLKSAAGGEPKGAALRGRIETDQSRRASYLRLTLSDFGLSRQDETQATAARRAAEREAFEKQKTDKPKF